MHFMCLLLFVVVHDVYMYVQFIFSQALIYHAKKYILVQLNSWLFEQLVLFLTHVCMHMHVFDFVNLLLEGCLGVCLLLLF